MTTSEHVPLEELEALALGDKSRAEEIGHHLRTCASCLRELEWLLTERALLARRPAPNVAGLWAGVESRIARAPDRLGAPRRKPHRARRTLVAISAVAAMVALVYMKPHHRPLITAPVAVEASDSSGAIQSALATLDKAEADYRRATDVLEAEYAT